MIKWRMMNQKRVALFKEYERLTGRPLLCYVTSLRSGVNVQMGMDAVPEIIRHINLIPTDKKEIDFLIISNGGDPICSLRIMNILSERFKSINVLVPYIAFSAATLLALGANKIVMHPYSNLGPVDPQIRTEQKMQDGTSVVAQYPAEDIKNYFNFIREDVGLIEQPSLTHALSALTQQVQPMAIGFAKSSSELAKSLCEKLLGRHMQDKDKAQRIARSLISSFYNHGYAVSRKEAKRIGLNVEKPSTEIEVLLWKIWEEFERDMQLSKRFNPQQEIQNNPEYQRFLVSDRETIQLRNQLYVASVESVSARSTNYDMTTVIANKVVQEVDINGRREKRAGINHIQLVDRTGFTFHRMNEGGE